MAAVVLIHSGSAAEMQFVSGQEWQFWYWVILRQIINFAVGTFFFLFGYLVDQQKVDRAPLQFISRRGAFGDPVCRVVWHLFFENNTT